jgi:cholesterol transport system auxiliary component
MSNMTRSLRRAALIAVSAVALSACGSILGPSEAPPQIYVLHPAFGPASAPSTQWQFGIPSPITADVYDTKRIAITRGQTMDYYADAAWTDQAPDMIQGLLVEAYEKSGKVKAVGRNSGGVRSDLLVVTEIRDFSAHYATQDGIPTVTVDIVAKLVTATHRDAIATYDSRKEIAASANTIPATVAAFNDATGQAIEDIVNWSLSNATPSASDALPPSDAPPVKKHRRTH